MKRFFISILTVSVFFLGLGALVETTSAKFKSDDKALALIAKARLAIGGDAAIANIQGMRIAGRTTQTLNMKGTTRTFSGDSEIALMLPDQLMRTMKLEDGQGMTQSIASQTVVMGEKLRTEAGSPAETKVFVTEDDNGSGPQKRIVIRKADGTEKVYTGAEADRIVAADAMSPEKGVKVIILKKPDGTTEQLTGGEADKVIVRRAEAGPTTWTSADGGKTVLVEGKPFDIHLDGARHNELLRLTLGLLLTAPQGIDVEYTFGGETDLDGIACNVVNAGFGGQTYKLFLDRSTNLPVGMTYTSMKMPMAVAIKRVEGQPIDVTKTIELKRVEGYSVDASKEADVKVRVGHPMGEMVTKTVKFTDYRSTSGVQLPYKWTQTVGGQDDETFEVTTYDVNPANLADSFKNQKVMVRVARPDNK